LADFLNRNESESLLFGSWFGGLIASGDNLARLLGCMILSWPTKSSVLNGASTSCCCCCCCLLELANLFPSAWKYEPIVRLLSTHSSELLDELDWLFEMTAGEAAVEVNLGFCPILSVFSAQILEFNLFELNFFWKKKHFYFFFFSEYAKHEFFSTYLNEFLFVCKSKLFFFI